MQNAVATFCIFALQLSAFLFYIKHIEAVDSTIPAVPTWQDRAAVDALLEDWNKLADKQKTLPEVAAAKDKLDAAIKAVEASEEEKANKEREELEAADKEAAEKFTAAVNSIPGSKAGEGKALLDNATGIYNTLTDSQKALISEETMSLYNEAVAAYEKDRIFKSGKAWYKVLGNGDVTYLKPADRSTESAVVPNQVKKGGFFFRVIKVSSNAFRNCKNLEWVIIHKNVYVLGRNIFVKTPKLLKVAIKGTGLKSGKVADAFLKAGKNGRITVKVPESKVDKYTALLKGEGGLNGTVKAA